MLFLTREIVEVIKKQYRSGDRVELIFMFFNYEILILGHPCQKDLKNFLDKHITFLF